MGAVAKGYDKISERKSIMGIKISTDNRGVKVWRSDKYEKPTYAIQISKKEGDTWVNEYQKVRFRGSPDIPNGTIIYIRDGFTTLETWVKDNMEHKRIVWVIMDYSYEGMKEAPNQSFIDMPEPDMPDSFSAAEDDIPF